MRVRAYKNLRRQVWSIQHPSTGLVLGHKPELVLLDVVLVVSEATRPAVCSSWSRVVVSPAEVMPAALMVDGVPRLLREMHEACNLYERIAGT